MNFEINYHPNLFREDTKQGGPVRLAKKTKTVFDEEIQNLIDIYREDGLLSPAVEAQINSFKNKMQTQFPSLFN